MLIAPSLQTAMLVPLGNSGRRAGRVRRRPERAGRTATSVERLEALDADLFHRARDAGRLRLEIGWGLELLERGGGDHALGFSSIEAYALERCEQSASWVQKARGLARRLDVLPAVAQALISGSINWSMAAVVATVARPDDADFWLGEAKRRTVREMKGLVLERRAADGADASLGGIEGDGGDRGCGEHLEAEDEMRTLTLTVPREDAWCFEQAKLLARHLAEGTRATDAEVMFGLVAESTSTLCGELPLSAVEETDDEAGSPQRAWERELARMRAEAELRCEGSFRRDAESRAGVERMSWPDSPEAIDRQLRELAHGFAIREIGYGCALDAFFAADGWRRLGYATARQYARERLGTSLSSIKSKRQLAKRLQRLGSLAEALARGELGYEAARLVAGVATCRTELAWVARAKERTLRHLREEIDVAELLARWSESSAVVPPSDADVRRVHELERAVVAGQISPPPAPPVVGPVPVANAASVTLRLRVHATTARDFRHWEARYLRHRGAALRSTTFLRFACELFTDTWRPRASEVAYGHVYERDRYRCQSPCCGRRDVTPHHLRFRSRGGDDSDENLVSVCTFCHLEGIHGGQISAAPPASSIRWTMGRSPHTIVEGRRRVRVSS